MSVEAINNCHFQLSFKTS